MEFHDELKKRGGSNRSQKYVREILKYFICKKKQIAKKNQQKKKPTKSWREHALNVDVNHVIKQEHDLKQR